MLSNQTNLPIELIDSLEQVINNPSGRHHWRRLNMAYSNNTNQSNRAEVKEIIINKVNMSGDAAFLRDTFLAYTCGDENYIVNASEDLLLSAMNQPDKTMTFVNYEIGRTLSSPLRRSNFQSEITQKKIPNLIHGLAQYISKHHYTTPTRQSIKHRIAIYTNNICSAAHPPTKLVLQHARLLSDLGYLVQIFCPQEEHINYAEEYLGNGGICVPKPFKSDQFQEYLGNRKISFSFCKTDYSLQTRWKSIAQLICEFQPELIFFIGLNSPLTEVLYQNFPILGLNTISTPQLASSDLWLCADKMQLTSNNLDWGKLFAIGEPYYYPYRVERNRVKQYVTRKDLNISKNSIILISVGARLQTEISGTWAYHMLNLLRENPNIIWLLVGGEGAYPEALQGLPESQIRCLKYTDNLSAIYQCCDIYINPPRMGGGFSVAEAMSEKLPVVSFHESDGGSKVGKFAASDLTTYLALCQDLIGNPTYRKRLGQQMKFIFDTTIDINQASTSLQSAVERCISNATKRLASSN